MTNKRTVQETGEYEVPNINGPGPWAPTLPRPMGNNDDWGSVEPNDTPRIGDRVFYYMAQGSRTDKVISGKPFGRWVRAYVIQVDSFGQRYEEPIEEGALNLEVISEPRIDHTSRRLVVRRDVAEGYEVGNWARRIDEVASGEEFAHGMEQVRMREQVGRELALRDRKTP